MPFHPYEDVKESANAKRRLSSPLRLQAQNSSSPAQEIEGVQKLENLSQNLN